MSPGVRLGGWSKGKPVPGRKRGRPRLGEEVDPNVQDMDPAEGLFHPVPRWEPDYARLEDAMAEAERLCLASGVYGN